MKADSKLKYVLAFGLGLSSYAAFGHDVPVHEAITYNAAASAYANSPAYYNFVNVISLDLSYTGRSGATNFMILGSALEDNSTPPIDEGGYRSINHFYDPLDTTYGKGLSDVPPDTREVIATNSFMWGSVSNCFGLHIIEGVTSNRWSWPNARGYEWLGLTATNKSDRIAALTNMFRAVGQVMHLVEDLSQPQHVRNEQHLDKLPGILNIIPSPWLSPIEEYGRKYVNQLNYGDGSMLAWRDAGFTKLEDFWDRHLYAPGSATVLQSAETGGAQLGLAEWCNGNFLGDRHLFPEYYSTGDIAYYPYPSRDHSTDYNAVKTNLLSGLHPLAPKNGPGNGIYLHKTTDGVNIQYLSRVNYLGAKLPNANLKGVPYCTIRDDNVLSNYHNIFIPKAVQYSAGLLDYFFRGNLGVGSTNLGDGTFGLYITNACSQDFSGGSFHLFYDDANGVRTELSSFSTTYSGSLASGDSIAAVRTPQTNAAQYILVYQGMIGTTSGQASDPSDGSTAVAAKNISGLIGWANDAQTGTVSCYGGGTQTAAVGPGTVFSLDSKADANAQAMALAQSQAQGQCPCQSSNSLSLSDGAWTGYYDPYHGYLSTDGWSVAGGTATYDSTSIEYDGVTYYTDGHGIAQTVCIPTAGYKLHCHLTTSYAGGNLEWISGPGFGCYMQYDWFEAAAAWNGTGYDSEMDTEVDLDVGQNLIFFEVPGGDGLNTDQVHLEIDFEIIAP